MNEKIKCFDCVKYKTLYCPCAIDCMATDDYPYYQNRKMMLEENANLKQALKEIKEIILYSKSMSCQRENHILQIIDKVLGEEND